MSSTETAQHEDAENGQRKDWSLSERVAIGRALEQEIGERRGGKQSGHTPGLMPETRELAAVKSGLGSDRTYRKGMFLDGRHRYLACKDAGVAPRYDEYAGSDPVGFVASSCVHRSLTSGQRAFIAAGFLEYEREQGHARMVVAGGVGGSSKGVENVPHPSSCGIGKSRDIAGSRMNVSGRSVDDAAKIIESGSPELIEKLRTGEIALREAKTISAFNPKAQANIVSLPKRERADAIDTANARSVAGW